MVQWEVYCLLLRTEIELKLNRYENAFPLLEKAEKITKEYEFNDQLTYVYNYYSKAYTQQGNLSKALEYKDLYSKLSISQAELNSRDKIKSIELEQKISENQRLLEKYDNERKTLMIIIGFSLFALLLASGLFYTINQNKKRKIANIEKDKIITEIELKNQQLHEELLKEKVKFNQEHLITFANQVEKIDGFLEKMRSQIRKLPVNPQIKNEINDLKMSFSEILGDQNQVKQINSLNSEINQDFFLEIRKKFNNLTKSEEQLLAFLIRDMSSKEIAEILKITTESVNKKRYRLRKKLEMDNEETFLDFYNKLIPR